jgi:hypothetical protein
MNSIETLALTAVITLATLTIMNQPLWIKLVKQLRLPDKPWLCPTCLPMWVTLIILLIAHPHWTIPLYALAASWLGTNLDRHNNTF